MPETALWKATLFHDDYGDIIQSTKKLHPKHCFCQQMQKKKTINIRFQHRWCFGQNTFIDARSRVRVGVHDSNITQLFFFASTFEAAVCHYRWERERERCGAARAKSSPTLQHKTKKTSEELCVLAAPCAHWCWLLSRRWPCWGATEAAWTHRVLPSFIVVFFFLSYVGVRGHCNHPLDVQCRNCETASTSCFFERLQSSNPPDKHQTRVAGRRRDREEKTRFTAATHSLGALCSVQKRK